MRDLKYVFSKSIKDTALSLKKNGLAFILLCGLVSFLSSLASVFFASGLIANLGYIINYFIQILLLSVLAKIMNNMVVANRIPNRDFKYYLEHYFINIMNTFFVIYIIELIYQFASYYIIFGVSKLDLTKSRILSVTILFIIEELILGSWFEAVYVDDVGGLAAIKRALNFIKDNFVPWTLISVPYLLLKTLSGGYLNGFLTIPMWARVLTSILMPVFMLLRGKAYLLLSRSTKRKRKFMMEYEN